MTRALFLSQLRQGLRGLDPADIDDICADYQVHFADAAESGRSETDVLAALGNPAQLAREWRVERGFKDFESQASPQSFLRAALALLGLAAFDIVILLPLLLGLMFAAGVAIYIFHVLGRTGFHLMAGLFFGDGHVLAPALVGVGMICGVVGAAALVAQILVAGLRLFARYVRLHHRLVKDPDR